ncbi:MAG TPA: hypothetical protein DCM64_05595 [Gammaproteobacteria bacterium]|nr:GNAT family N-acetyltransferase [Gammaproteobacteria bacterium]MDP6732815.1 GNAT family N-acetyltransferase [Gammaproteobacteria bacterium]HAJ75909.1 hypothetical protein [Gammaproteobacteria bacterium]
MVTINADLLLPGQRLYAKVFELEFGECHFLHYGLGGDRPALGDRTDSESVLEMQRRFDECLWQEIGSEIQHKQRVLLAGHSLGELAVKCARQGLQTTWLSSAGKFSGATDIGNNLNLQESDLLASNSGADFDVIVVEGSYHYLDQLPILNKCRELIKGDGSLIVFGEYLDDDSSIERSTLPNLSSFKQLSDRLGYDLVSDQELTLEAQSSLAGFVSLLRHHGSTLVDQKVATDEDIAELEKQLEGVNHEFNSGRRCFRLFRLNKVANPTGEYVNAEYSDIHSFQPHEIADLFKKSFGKEFDPALWHWKYELGDGKCVIARQHRGGEIVSHYGGAPREIIYFGSPSMAIQPGDVMVLPEIRRHYGKSSLFFKTAATFLEREIGNTVNHLLGFGFPNQPTMNIALRLGLYEKTDAYVEVIYSPPEENLNLDEGGHTVLDIEDPVQQQELDNLWQQMTPDFAEGIIGMRHWQYMKYRYYDHPFGIAGHYRCLVLREGDAHKAWAIAVLKREGERQLLMDLICPLSSIKRAIAQLNQVVAEDDEVTGLKMWITKSWLDSIQLEGAIVNELGIEIPCNSWNPGPSAETLYGAWWLTAGDMDFI